MGWESAVQGIFKKLGFEVHRTLPGSTYVQCAPFTYSTYHPWFEESFQKFYRQIEPYTTVTPDRCYLLAQLCKHALNLEGALAECGVYRGGTARLLAQTARDKCQGRELHLFDTFAGMPALANADPSAHAEGDFGDVTLAGVRQLLADFPDVHFYPGVIPTTFAAVPERRFCFAHLDLDLYQSTLDACAYFYPRMQSGGVIVFDDYGFPHYKDAAQKAVDEFFASRPESPIVMRTGQCVVLKL